MKLRTYYIMKSLEENGVYAIPLTLFEKQCFRDFALKYELTCKVCENDYADFVVVRTSIPNFKFPQFEWDEANAREEQISKEYHERLKKERAEREAKYKNEYEFDYDDEDDEDGTPSETKQKKIKNSLEKKINKMLKENRKMLKQMNPNMSDEEIDKEFEI